jgi:hypothetical protein
VVRLEIRFSPVDLRLISHLFSRCQVYSRFCTSNFQQISISMKLVIFVSVLAALALHANAGCTSCKTGYDFINEESYYNYQVDRISVPMYTSQCRSACNKDPNCYGYAIYGRSSSRIRTCSHYNPASKRGPKDYPYSIVCAGVCSWICMNLSYK